MIRKKIISLLILTLSALLLISCRDAQTGDTQTEDTQTGDEKYGSYLKDDNVFVVGTEQLPYSEEEIYQQLFDLKNVIQIHVDISEEELQKLQEDYDKYSKMHSKSPIYREASMYITIADSANTYTYFIPNVGVRMKGNTSRTSFYDKNEGQYNLIHLRIKFQDGDFATLENLEMKWNRNDDSTYIREYYAYEMYRDFGLLAPRTNLASTDLGALHQGVFTIYEPVDKNFIERYVDEADRGGDLYKCGWTGNGATLTKECSIGVEDEETGKFYNYDLKTNKKSSEHTQMKNLIHVLNSGNVTKQDLEAVVDMESFLRFAAVSYFVGNPDDIRNDYNNYYIYFLKSSGKAVIIPYDCDRVFGVTKGWNPSGNAMTEVDPFSTKAEGAHDDQKNPLFRYTVDKGGYYTEEYALQLKLVSVSRWLQPEYFAGYYSLASRNYFLYTAPGKVFRNAENYDFSFDLERSEGLNSDWGNASFEAYITAKLKAYNQYMETYYND